MITIVATLCHLVPAPAGDAKVIPLCHETVLHEVETLPECVHAWAGIADWKMKSRYAGDDWIISNIRCMPGTFVPRDVI